jgi:hypothetical protein
LNGLLPSARLWIQLAYQEDEHRSMLVSAYGERYMSLLDEFRKAIFGAI